MGTSGPGNITHIDNLYVKTFNVKDDVNISLGQFVVIEDDAGFAVARPLLAGDVLSDGLHVDLTVLNIVQAAENANNLTTTDALLRKGQIECITKGSDWVVVIDSLSLPDSTVGISREDTALNSYVVTDTIIANEILGVYKHKEFSTVAQTATLLENAIISTGRHV